MTDGTYYRCPLPTCDWGYVEPPVEEWPAADPGPDAGDDPVGTVVFATLLENTLRTEAVLRDHFQTHTLDDWVLQMSRLREDLKRLGAAAGPGPSWIRPSEERIDNAVQAMEDLVRAVRSMNDLTDEQAAAWRPSKFTRSQWHRFADTVLRADAKWRAEHPDESA